MKNRAPLDSDRSTSRRLAMARTCFGAFVAALLSVACHDWLTVPPLNDPTAGGREAARGFGKTMEALELSYITAQRHNYGALVEMKADPTVLAAFVSRDSVQNYIIGRLDEARAHLLTADPTFPFKLHAGFTT